MKADINLFNSKFDYQKAERKFQGFRLLTLTVSVIFLIFLVASFAYLGSQTKKIQELTSRKSILTQETAQKINQETDLNYVARKVDLMDSFLKDDAHALPYFNLLNNALSTATGSANLSAFNINQNRDVSFTVDFDNFDQMLAFFRFVESDSFLKKFESLTLGSFASKAVQTTTGGDRNYSLSFDGRFIEIKE